MLIDIRAKTGSKLNNAKVIIKSDVKQHIMTMDGGNRRGVDMEQTVNDLVPGIKVT